MSGHPKGIKINVLGSPRWCEGTFNVSRFKRTCGSCPQYHITCEVHDTFASISITTCRPIGMIVSPDGGSRASRGESHNSVFPLRDNDVQLVFVGNRVVQVCGDRQFDILESKTGARTMKRCGEPAFASLSTTHTHKEYVHKRSARLLIVVTRRDPFGYRKHHSREGALMQRATLAKEEPRSSTENQSKTFLA